MTNRLGMANAIRPNVDTCYIVSFEISNTATRLKFVESLKSFGTYCPINGSCWAIKTEKSAADVVNQLKGPVAATDKIFVVRSGTAAAWINALSSDHSEWLKKNL